MNPELGQQIETLVGDLPETERAKAREILLSCEFQDTSNPVFGLLCYLQLRAKSDGDKESPLAAEVRQMALEMDNRLWEARRFKLTFFILCLGLSAFFGGLLVGGTFFHMAKVNPAGTMNYFGLADPQLTQLKDAGVRLRTEDKQTHIAVGIKGTLDESAKRADGEIVLLYRKEP